MAESNAEGVRVVPFDSAQIPMGPGSEQAIADLLAHHLDPSSASFGEALRQMAGRVDRDSGRLPWSTAVLAWLARQDARTADRTVQVLVGAATDERAPVARGAVFLLLGIADQAAGAYDDRLFDLATTAPEESAQRLLGAYLLASPRTRPRALAELGAVPSLAQMVDHQMKVQASLETWRRVVAALGAELDSPYVPVFLDLVESHPEIHFDLQNSYLDLFDAADEAQRQRMVRLLLEVLQHRGEGAQLFVCDLLTYPPVLEAAQRDQGYRLTRLLHRLEQQPETPPRVRHGVVAILHLLETSATAGELETAARGRLEQLPLADRVAIAEALNQAAEHFAAQSASEVVQIQGNPAWGVADYAHVALQVVSEEPLFPVPLEALCRKLGICLLGVDLGGAIDGLLIQNAALPGPVVLYNLAVQSASRRRFTVAHEIGHTLLPWHAEHSVYLSTVVEAAAERRLDDAEREVAAAAEQPMRAYAAYEREADQFAAALLMPPRWFGPAVRRRSFTMAGLEALSQAYGVSLTAAAFQAIQQTREPVAVVYSEDGRVRYRRMTDEFWELAGADAEILHRLRPQTVAVELSADGAPAAGSATLSAALWLSGTSLAEVREESVRMKSGHLLTILQAVKAE